MTALPALKHVARVCFDGEGVSYVPLRSWEEIQAKFGPVLGDIDSESRLLTVLRNLSGFWGPLNPRDGDERYPALGYLPLSPTRNPALFMILWECCAVFHFDWPDEAPTD